MRERLKMLGREHWKEWNLMMTDQYLHLQKRKHQKYNHPCSFKQLHWKGKQIKMLLRKVSCSFYRTKCLKAVNKVLLQEPNNNIYFLNMRGIRPFDFKISEFLNHLEGKECMCSALNISLIMPICTEGSTSAKAGIWFCNPSYILHGDDISTRLSKTKQCCNFFLQVLSKIYLQTSKNLCMNYMKLKKNQFHILK